MKKGNWLAALDQWLLDKGAQRLADKWTKKTGLPCIMLAHLFVWVCITATSYMIITKVAPLAMKGVSWRGILSSLDSNLWLNVVLCAVYFIQIGLDEFRDSLSGGKGFLNFRRVFMPYGLIRISFMAVTAGIMLSEITNNYYKEWGTRNVLILLSEFSYLLYIYLIACTPTPPPLKRQVEAKAMAQ